jgi:hypothetical protein
MTRLAGKHGRRPPKQAPSLHLGDFLTGVTPNYPPSADYLNLGGWQMLGNDAAGDCVAVTWANLRRLISTVLTVTSAYYPTQDEVWTIYKTQNPTFDPNGGAVNGPGSSADGGMDIQTLLEYLVATGGPDGVKAVCFASVDHTNVAEVKAAIAIFGGVWVGINVLDVNMTEFNADQPWDYSATATQDGGHSVLAGGYGVPGVASLGGDERFITWAAETSFTDAFWTNEVEECWVVIWPEHLGTATFEQGVNLVALEAAFTEITGQQWPVEHQ